MTRHLPGTITSGKPVVRHLAGTVVSGVPLVRHLPGTIVAPKNESSSLN